MYIFFNQPFAVTILSPQFDPKFPFDGVPLHMVHRVFDPPPPSPFLDMETGPSEASSPATSTQSSNLSTPPRGDQTVPDTRFAAIVENDFYSP